VCPTNLGDSVEKERKNVPRDKEKQTLARRDALKTLSVVTGVVTLAGLTGKWGKPIVHVKALPAHTQCSAGILAKINDQFVPSAICQDYSQWQADISYSLQAAGEALYYEVLFSGGTGGEAMLLFIDGECGGLVLTFFLDFGTHDWATLALRSVNLRGCATNHFNYRLSRPKPLTEPEPGEFTTERYSSSGQL
jgi:hypothetical protein